MLSQCLQLSVTLLSTVVLSLNVSSPTSGAVVERSWQAVSSAQLVTNDWLIWTYDWQASAVVDGATVSTSADGIFFESALKSPSSLVNTSLRFAAANASASVYFPAASFNSTALSTGATVGFSFVFASFNPFSNAPRNSSGAVQSVLGAVVGMTVSVDGVDINFQTPASNPVRLTIPRPSNGTLHVAHS